MTFETKQQYFVQRARSNVLESQNISETKLIQENKYDTNEIFSLCLTEDRRIACCSTDQTIKILNQKTLEIDLILEGHKNWVNHVSLLDNGCLVSSSSDTTIKIWKINKDGYKLVKTLQGHKGAVLKTIQLSNNRIGSCSFDESLKIWKSSEPYDEIITIPGESSFDSLIELKNKKYIVSVSENNVIRFFNNSTYKCEKSIGGVECFWQNSLVETDDNRIIVGGGDGVISIINTVTFQLETKIKLSKDVCDIYSLLYFHSNGGDVLLGDSDGNLFQVELKELKIISIKNDLHDDWLTDLLLFDKNTLVSCSTDRIVKMWKL